MKLFVCDQWCSGYLCNGVKTASNKAYYPPTPSGYEFQQLTLMFRPFSFPLFVLTHF